ncbi:MAG: hypothetical protein EOO05_08595 [Chitinophagaceae bacterium]|nr:MAG: hypothetical protein EOO05_08595 [Chitinophagaceae bacterium]
MNYRDLIPEATRGKNTELSAVVDCGTDSNAKKKFELAARRLLAPDTWAGISGKPGAEFLALGSDLQEKPALIKPGSYIRIDIPGPGPKNGGGYDWVVIQDLKRKISDNGEDFVGLTVTPCANPFSTDPSDAHFLEQGSTSTFIILREKKVVSALYFGRNEKINTAVPGIADKLRNTVTGLGAFAGLSEAQWQKLIDGFIS